MTEYTNITIRDLLEADSKLRKLEKAFQADGDKLTGAKLEKEYYRGGDYISARRTRLSYKPYMIIIARTRLIPGSGGRVPGRIVLYLHNISGNRPEWATWFYNKLSNHAHGNYFHGFDDALRNFWDRAEEYGIPFRGGFRAGGRNLDTLPDGYPSDFLIYRAL